MDVFNQCLASRIAANPLTQDAAKSRLEFNLDEDFSLDFMAHSRAFPKFPFSAEVYQSFWEEEKVVQDLVKFGLG